MVMTVTEFRLWKTFWMAHLNMKQEASLPMYKDNECISNILYSAYKGTGCTVVNEQHCSFKTSWYSASTVVIIIQHPQRLCGWQVWSHDCQTLNLSRLLPHPPRLYKINIEILVC